MRASSVTLVLVLLALAAAAWRWIDGADTAPPPPLGKPLVSFGATEVSAIQLRRARATAILKPVDGVWHITSPLRDRIDPTAALALYLGLNGLVLHEILPEKDWRARDESGECYGLGRKAVRVRLLGNDKRMLYDFRIGDITPWLKDGAPTMYFQWKNGPRPDDIFIVGGNLRMLLDRPLDALRARQALYLPCPPIKITLAAGPQHLELARTTPDSPWRITKPIDDRANDKAVDALLKSLSELEATALMPRSPNTGDATLSLARLDIVMASARDTPPPPPIEAGFFAPLVPGGDLQSRWSDRNYDLSFAPSALALLKPDTNRFRSRSLGDYVFENTSELLLRNPGGTGAPVVLRKDGGEWRVFLRDQWMPADPARIQQAVDMLAACPVIGHPTDSLTRPADYGLDQPVLQVALRAAGATTEHLAFGKADGKTYAHRNNSLSVYEIPEGALGSLPIHPAAWRGRQLFRFAAIDVRQLVWSPAANDETTLRYNPEENLWLANRNGRDLSAELDPASAANLTTALERLAVTRWLAGGTADALARLANPHARLGITVASFNDDGNPGPLIRHLLELAPVADGSPFFFGRFAGEPDIFLLKQSTLTDLFAPLFPAEKQ